ncbi:MAG: 2-dehydropantoate 2-reductase [Bacillales bacterium]|nr:2-dehydropantoate 2-reductase [Bacillales bacterium]
MDVKNEMKIGVIGGGSIGLFYAANLSKWLPVTVYTRTARQSKAILEEGIALKENGREQRELVCAKQLPDADLIDETFLLVAVKQYHLQGMVPFFRQLSPDVSLLFLQNGMGHLFLLEQLPQKNIYLGTVEHGVLKEQDTIVRVRGRGMTNVSVYRGSQPFLEKFVSHTDGSFPFQFHQNYRKMLLAKLFANAMINPLSAVLKVPNGELIKNPYYYQLLTSMFTELVSVFPEYKSDDIFNKVLDIIRKTAENRSSMLIDLENGRKTEIDAILGYVLKIAEQKQISTPMIQTFYWIIKGLESHLDHGH